MWHSVFLTFKVFRSPGLDLQGPDEMWGCKVGGGPGEEQTRTDISHCNQVSLRACVYIRVGVCAKGRTTRYQSLSLSAAVSGSGPETQTGMCGMHNSWSNQMQTKDTVFVSAGPPLQTHAHTHTNSSLPIISVAAVFRGYKRRERGEAQDGEEVHGFENSPFTSLPRLEPPPSYRLPPPSPLHPFCSFLKIKK